ncbi:MAG: hypothetical protein WCI17_03830 [bacterium]
MRGEFAAEQMGVAARQHNDVPLPLEAVCEQFPPIDILNFIEQDELHPGGEFDQDFQYAVEITRGKAEPPDILSSSLAIAVLFAVNALAADAGKAAAWCFRYRSVSSDRRR